MDIVVSVADLKISNRLEHVLVTHALGSCIGVAIYDPEVRVGGLLHYMLPESSLDAHRALENPYLFADTGIPLLFRECYRLGAQKQRLKVKVAGGGQVLGGQEYFQIGRRNYAALRRLLLRNKMLIDREDVGGCKARTLYLEIATGRTWVQTTGLQIIEL